MDIDFIQGRQINLNKRKKMWIFSCGTNLFSSIDKFDSGTGGPGFVNPVSLINI